MPKLTINTKLNGNEIYLISKRKQFSISLTEQKPNSLVYIYETHLNPSTISQYNKIFKKSQTPTMCQA